jgi:hypothetical protein
MSRPRALLVLGLLATAAALSGCNKPPPPAPPPPPVVPRPPPPPPPLAPGFTVTALNLGNALYVDRNVTAPATSFGRKETIYLSVVSDGVDPAVVLRVRWYGPKGILVKEGSQTIASLGPKATVFQLDKASGLAVGSYSVEVFVNDRPSGTKQFDVLAKPPGKK